MTLIKAENLHKTYHTNGVETPAVCGVSFEINQGEFVAVMGPSGCGKSSLMHILGFLDIPTKGEYLFEEKSMKEYGEDELARIRNKKMGFVFQAFNLLPRLTVYENVKLPLIYSALKQGLWRERALKAIDEVGLSQRADYQTLKLSGGEKQRVAIARALVNQPPVLFADEPTGNLDSKSGAQVMDILERLNQRGHTIILVTHETYTAQYAGRIIRLKDGQIESDGKVESRRQEAKNSFIK